MKFGDRLKLLLDEKEITQKDFAEKLNIAPTTLNGYIKNKREPNIDLILQISYELNISVDLLLGSKNTPDQVTLKEMRMLKKYRSLHTDQQHIVEVLIDTINNTNKKL